jgi:cytochrome P450
MHVVRTAVAPVELEEYKLSRGDPVALWLAAGNRDPEIFAEPDRFCISRNPNPHLAFSTGAHYCLGSALATMELSVIFEELLRRVRTAELTEPPRRTRSILIWGYDSAHMRLAAA